MRLLIRKTLELRVCIQARRYGLRLEKPQRYSPLPFKSGVTVGKKRVEILRFHDKPPPAPLEHRHHRQSSRPEDQTPLTSKLRQQIDKAMGRNPGASTVICTGVTHTSRPAAVNALTRKRAANVCAYVKKNYPDVKTWYQSKRTSQSISEGWWSPSRVNKSGLHFRF